MKLDGFWLPVERVWTPQAPLARRRFDILFLIDSPDSPLLRSVSWRMTINLCFLDPWHHYLNLFL